MIESHEAKIARIDANVQTLLKALPVIQRLDKESEVNKRDHKFAAWIAVSFASVAIWAAKKLGVEVF